MLCPASHWGKGIPGSSAGRTPGEMETQRDADRVASCLVHLFKSVNPGAKSGRGPAVHLAKPSAEKHWRSPNEQRVDE